MDSSPSDPLVAVVGGVWIVGYAAIVIAKHTVFSDTWGSRDLALHWHYWAWQAAWTALALLAYVVAARIGRAR